MGRLNQVVLAFVGLGLTALPITHLNAADDARGKLTVTLDDTYANQDDNGFPIFQKYGIRGTLFAVAEFVEGASDKEETEEPYHMTWEQVRKWHNAGWEIGAHSLTHPEDLTALSEEQLQVELGYSAALLAHNIGEYPVSFASPYGKYDERVLGFIETLYDYHFGGGGGLVKLPLVDPYEITRLEVLRDTSPKEVCAAMQKAGKEKLLLVLVFHQIVKKPLEGEDGLYQLSVTNLDEMMQCAGALAAAYELDIVTAKEALAHRPPS